VNTRITTCIAKGVMTAIAVIVLAASSQPAFAEGIIVQGSVKQTSSDAICLSALKGADVTNGQTSAPCGPQSPVTGSGGTAPITGAEYGSPDDVPEGWDCWDIGGGLEYCQPPGTDDEADPTVLGEEQMPGDGFADTFMDDGAGCSGGQGSTGFGFVIGLALLALLAVRRRTLVG